MSEENDRKVALARLWQAAQALSVGALEELVIEAENRLKWEKALAVGRYLASQRTTPPLGPQVLVNYDHHWMPFAEKIGLSKQRATRFWTALFKGYRRVNTIERREEFRAAEVSIQELRTLLRRKRPLSDDDHALLEVWLLNL
jgi:hypothetical protein